MLPTYWKINSELFAAEGAWVLVTDSEDEQGEETERCIREKGGSADHLHADASQPADAARAIEVAARQNGRVDILCNNAAYLGEFHAIVESTPEEWDRCIRLP